LKLPLERDTATGAIVAYRVANSFAGITNLLCHIRQFEASATQVNEYIGILCDHLKIVESLLRFKAAFRVLLDKFRKSRCCVLTYPRQQQGVVK
jgi:hypothetical protein